MELKWQDEQLYFSGDEFFAAVTAAIEKAVHSVKMETYIFERGVLGDRIAAALSSAASRGVDVQVMVDGLGSPNFLNEYWTKLRRSGVRIRLFRVIPYILRRLPGDPDGFFKRLLGRWRQVNRGNHRKFILVDKETLFVGSFNISDVHLREVHGEKAWKDVGVRVQGRDLRYADRAFQRAYRGWTAFNLPARSPELLLLNDSYLHKRSTRNQHIYNLKRARQRIWLATPYFVPIGRVFRALVSQARSGVDVRLIVPDKSDVFFMPWLSLPLLRELAKNGVKVFIYKPQFAHQKIFIADDFMCIGSTNLNHRSFLHDLEMDVVLTSRANKKILVESYEKDQLDSEPFDRSNWGQLPFWQRVLSSWVIVLKYWA